MVSFFLTFFLFLPASFLPYVPKKYHLFFRELVYIATYNIDLVIIISDKLKFFLKPFCRTNII